MLKVITTVLVILNYSNNGRTISYSEWMHLMFMLQDDSPSICLQKAMALRQETRAVRENQLISSHRFTKHLKQCCTQNSERLLEMLADEKDGLRKITSSRKSAVSADGSVGGLGRPPSWHNQIWLSQKEGAG